MTLKKDSIFTRFLIGFIISFSNFLNFFDFKLRNIFIFLNIFIISFVLMFYVKPVLDRELAFTENNKSIIASEPKLNLPDTQVTTTLPPETLPVKKLIINDNIKVNARSFIVYDLKNNEEIMSREKETTLPPASLVKMLSIMYFYPKVSLDSEYRIVPECNMVEGQKVGFKKSEKVTGKDLIYSSLVFSAGDSICNLYKITNSNLDEFNQYSVSLGMKNSKFTNFIGLDYPGNFTTSDDMLIMTKEFIKNELFNQITSLKSYKMESGKIVYNTNKTLFEDTYSVGIKTGTTAGARENLIYRYKNNEKDLDVLVILLNSNSRYQDVKNIISSIKSD